MLALREAFSFARPIVPKSRAYYLRSVNITVQEQSAHAVGINEVDETSQRAFCASHTRCGEGTIN